MLHLSEWSIARVLMISVAWIILVVGWQVLQFYLAYRRMRAQSNGIGAMSIGIYAGSFLVLVGPPIGLLVVWLVLRYMHRT